MITPQRCAHCKAPLTEVIGAIGAYFVDDSGTRTPAEVSEGEHPEPPCAGWLRCRATEPEPPPSYRCKLCKVTLIVEPARVDRLNPDGTIERTSGWDISHPRPWCHGWERLCLGRLEPPERPAGGE